MSISVGHKWAPGAVYIGRPSPLGNPFVMKNEAERDRVCDAYEAWFEAQVKLKTPEVMQELRKLYKLSKQGHVVLGCYCAPKRCHGDTIKRWLEEQGA